VFQLTLPMEAIVLWLRVYKLGYGTLWLPNMFRGIWNNFVYFPDTCLCFILCYQ